MGKTRKRVFELIAYVLFGAINLVILSESFIPSDASGKRSYGFSQILADIINSLTPTQPAIELKPTSLSLSPIAIKALVGEEEELLYENDEAIIGTTKAYSYSLQYENTKADVYDSQVGFEVLSSPGEGSFTKSISGSTKSGTVRIIPLEEGFYSFALTDASGHQEKMEFNAIKRKQGKGISSDIEALTVPVGGVSIYPYALTFGDLTRTDTSVDHYLARYIDPSLVRFASSDESIFTVEEGGIVRGKTSGDAELLFNEEKVADIHVEAPTVNREGLIRSMSLEASSTTISALDYDDETLGIPLTPHFYDEDGQELLFEETPALHYSSANDLIAMVRDAHLEKKEEGFARVEGGIVYGYRQFGEAKITATLLFNPDVTASIDFLSTQISPTGVTYSFASGKTSLQNGDSLDVGKTVNITASFTPKNAYNKNIHVDVSDPNLAKPLNNNSTSVSVSLLDGGEVTISVYSLALGEESKESLALTLVGKPTIPDKEMNDFASLIRKAFGHFLIFAVMGFFGAIAFFLTLPERKREWIPVFFLSLLPGAATAFLSEAIQAIPALKRSCSLTDVGIDSLGYLLGVASAVLLLLIIFLIYLCIKKGKKAKK